MKKMIVVLALLVGVAYMAAMSNCHCKVEATHSPNCAYTVMCGVEWDYAGARAMLTGDTSPDITITLPPWLSLSGVESEMLLVAVGQNTSNAPRAAVSFTPTEIMGVSGAGNVLVLKPILTAEVKNEGSSFLDACDPTKDIDLKASTSWQNFVVRSTGPEVYEPFETTVSLSANGAVLTSQSFSTSLPEQFGSYLSSVVDQIPDTAYKNNPQERRRALHNKLNGAVNALRAHNAKGAHQILQNDIMSLFDGANGGNASNDWISDSFAASNTYGPFEKVLNLVDLIGGN